MIRHKRLATSGFTLLEAMLATVILAFALTSVLALLSHASRFVSDFRKTARSTQILQQKMEDIRLLSWSQLAAYTNSFVDTYSGTYSGTVAQSTFDTYNGTATVKTVTLTVTWKNQRGLSVTNTLTSLVSNGGINTYIF